MTPWNLIALEQAVIFIVAVFIIAAVIGICGALGYRAGEIWRDG